MQERRKAERRAIWPCLNVATWQKGAKLPSHTTNTIKFDRIPFDPCNSIKRFNLCPFDQKKSPIYTHLSEGNRSKDLAGTEIAKQSWSELVFATVRATVQTPDMPHISVFRFLKILGGGAFRTLCGRCPVYTGYAQYENSNLVSRNYSIRAYCTSSNSNLVNRTYCQKPS